MCGELLLSCAIRSSACNYTSCAHKLIYRFNVKKCEYNVICATSCHWAAVWGRPLATIIIVHTTEYRGYLWKHLNKLYCMRRAAPDLRYEVISSLLHLLYTHKIIIYKSNNCIHMKWLCTNEMAIHERNDSRVASDSTFDTIIGLFLQKSPVKKTKFYRRDL